MVAENLIGDLLLKHNCVVIPAFGGFVARTQASQIDYKQGTIHPPRKLVLFNRQLMNNDGLYIAALAAVTQQSYDDAFQSVQSLVKSWNQKLHAGERISIDKVGYLFLDAEKNIGFEQDRNFNLLLQAYGLTSVNFISEEDIVRSASAELSTEELLEFSAEHVQIASLEQPIIHLETENKVLTSNQESTQKPVRKLITRYVAAAALLPVVFYTYWIPMKTPFLESGIVASNDFNPFGKQFSPIYKQQEKTLSSPEEWKNTESLEDELKLIAENVSVYSFEFNDLYIPVRLKNTLNQEVQTTDFQQTSTQTGNLHYIVGCFSSKENADNLVIDLNKKGFSAYVVDVANGFHRVSCARASSAEEFKGLNEKLTSLNINPWILVK
jgi:hypothetical protein